MPEPAEGSAEGAAASPSGPSARAVAALALAVAGRPDLWWTAVGVLLRLAPPGWWRSRPHLPLPDGRLWAFRMVTAYGRPDRIPDRADVVSYLEWCRSTTGTGRSGRCPVTGRP